MSVQPVILDAAVETFLSVIYDELANDDCLVELLGRMGRTITKGSGMKCGEPIESWEHRPIQRFEQPLQAGFHNVVVRYGNFQIDDSPLASAENVEEWRFRAMVYTQRTVSIGAEEMGGGAWAFRTYAQVRRILGWNRTGIASDEICVLRRIQTGGLPLEFDDKRDRWMIGGNFTWVVVVRGLIPPADPFCC